jgi:DNA-binding NarL/FixJ family response regulator
MKIAIAEDETLPALTLHAGLTSRGYTVLKPVATGTGILELAGKERFDVVIMDINLRGSLKGLDAAAMLKEEYSDIKIIFVTGYEDQASYDQAMELKPAAFLRKPFVIADITTILENISAS